MKHWLQMVVYCRSRFVAGLSYFLHKHSEERLTDVT